MTQHIITELRICKNPACKKEYEATILNLLGARIIWGSGYCPDCAKKVEEEREAKEKLVRESEIMATRRRWRNCCGIPPKFMNEDFSTFKKERQPKVFKVCWDYAEQYQLEKPRGYKSLLLFSSESWGVGKTHLACAIAHRILDRWNGEDISCPVLFVSEPDLYMQIQATYNYPPEEKTYRENETDIIKRLTSVRLLFIDDIGKRRVHDPRFVQRIMFSIIDGRYKAMLPMVMTANLNPDRLAEYLGGGQGDEATMDRLVEMSKGKFYQIEGESFRKHGR
jgi:DNA replication protein DnaC